MIVFQWEGKEEQYVLTTAYNWNDGSIVWQRTLLGTNLGGYAYNEEGLAFQIDHKITKLSLPSGDIGWELNLPEDRGGSMFRSNNALFVMGTNSYLHQIDWQTGFYRWRQDLRTIFGHQSRWGNIYSVKNDSLILSVFLNNGESSEQGVALLKSGGKPSWPIATRSSTPTPSPFPTSPDFTKYLGVISPPPAEWTPTPILVPWATQQPKAGFVSADLDGDHDEDLILNLPALYLEQNIRWLLNDDPNLKKLKVQCKEIAHCPWAVIIFEQEDGQFHPVYKFDSSDSIRLMDSVDIIWVGDLNGDKYKEIVIYDTTCGSACSYMNSILSRAKNQPWHINTQIYGQLRAIDEDNNGVKALIAHQSLFCGMSEIGGRPYDEIYKWFENSYKRVGIVTPPFPFIYFRLQDAYNALQQGKLDKALEMLGTSITQPETNFGKCMFLLEEGKQRTASYAGILAMLVYGSRGEIGAMEAVLYEIEQRYSSKNNPYIQAARQLLNTYNATNNIVVACDAMARYIEEHRQTAAFAHDGWLFQPLCPLTDPQVWE